MSRVIKTLNLQKKYGEALSLLDKYEINLNKVQYQPLIKEIAISRDSLKEEERKRKELMKKMMGVRDDVKYNKNVENIMNEVQK